MAEVQISEAAASKSPDIVRVCVAIPNEGHTQVEAYANRLLNFMHLGKLQEQGFFEKLIRQHCPEKYDAVMADYKKAQLSDRLMLTMGDKRFEFYFVTMGRILTPLAREEAANFAEAVNADYLFMIDDDMTCPDDLFERLYRHDVDIVAPLAFTRNYPHKPVLYSTMEGWDHVSQKEYFINHYVMNYPKDKLVECDAVGFGAALIKMDVVRRMEKPRFMSTCGTGEDVYFCHKAKKLGFRVFMDTSTKLGHLSHPIQVTETYVEQIRKDLDHNIQKNYGEYKKYAQPKESANGVVVLGE